MNDDSWRRSSAAELAARLFQTPDAHPFWADGGDTGGPFAPAAHALAAWPSSVTRARVTNLPEGGFEDWVRGHLETPNGQGEASEDPEAPLVVMGLAYDAGRRIERIPDTARDAPPMPDLIIAHYPAYIWRESPDAPWSVHAVTPAAGADFIARLQAPMRSTPQSHPAPPKPALPRDLADESHQPAWDAAIASTLAGIAAGDFYQANISRRLSAPMDPAATPELYARLRAVNPAAYGLLWALDPATWIASSSPECLLEWDPVHRRASSFPIKGTRPRDSNPAHDRTAAKSLNNSAKDRAEHVMIVDLVRNDLGRVAIPGGVDVPHLFAPMTLPTVHHLVSEVRAQIRPDADLAAILTALFPGGSITGAPKVAAMVHIESIEGLRRGFYTGSVGLIRGRGRAVFNLLIRTCVVAAGRVYYQTGGGIVADSDASDEWDETVAKAAALKRALAPIHAPGDASGQAASPEPKGGAGETPSAP